MMNWSVALPELGLSCCGLAILLFGSIQRKRETFFLASMLVIGALLLTAVLVIVGPIGLAYRGQFINDSFSKFVKLLVLVGAAVTVVASLEYDEHQNLRRFEFPVLILFASAGMMVMASAANLMTLYVGLELQSLSIYVLVAFARDQLRSSEAGLKYFVLGSLASGLLLYGVSLVYGFAGSMQFEQLSATLGTSASIAPGVIVGIIFVLVGLAFKVSAVPFHMWTPDVYEGAPTPVTLFLGTAPKVAAMALLVRTMTEPFGHLMTQWQQLVVIVSVASMILGALGAIGQRNIKRLMAYSAIGHMGYVLIGIAAGTPDGMRGVLIYLVTYVFMSAGTFACILTMRRHGEMLEQILDLSGLGRRDPFLALLFAVFMFSLAGIPPLSGFWAKYFVFAAAVQSGLWVLAVIGVLTSVVGAYYYIRIIKVIYFDKPTESFDPRPRSVSILGGVCGLITVIFFVILNPFVGAAEAAAKVLFR